MAVSHERVPLGGTSRMVGEVGVEPTANGLKGHCSTTELLTRVFKKPAESSENFFSNQFKAHWGLGSK